MTPLVLEVAAHEQINLKLRVRSSFTDDIGRAPILVDDPRASASLARVVPTVTGTATDLEDRSLRWRVAAPRLSILLALGQPTSRTIGKPLAHE